MLIRAAAEADVPAILAIFNAEIASSLGLWIEKPATLEERRVWFGARRAQGYPVLVAEEGGAAVGYGSFGDFRPYEGFRFTVEHSIFVAEGARGRGAGNALLTALIEEARRMGKRVMVGAIDSNNEASLALHLGMGFRETGRMPGVGDKFGQRLTMVLTQKEL